MLYGFSTLRDVYGQRVTTVGVNVINQAIEQAVAAHNQTINALMSLFATRTTDTARTYKQGGTRRLQPGAELSRAMPTKGAPPYSVGFPLQKGMDALGLTYEASIKITVSEVADLVNQMLMADARWMRDHLLSALLGKVAWTFTDPQLGAQTVQPLANADTVLYNVIAGADAGATDQHYLAQTAAIADATNPYDDIREELMEHPENDGEVIALIPTALTATTKALANFEPMTDTNIRYGDDQNVLTGTLGVAHPGRLIGYTDQVWVAEWRGMPANTIIAVATGGERALAMREHPEAELQGFGKDDDRNDYPYYEQQWARRAGFGANNRVGAVAFQVNNGDTTFDVPSGFQGPIA